ncbi:MAG: type I glutamate--ammonia ligase [Lachnospiraceae bacterium]|nr:type I glutamate--ammonia ligase [Lachnospiraceae bacterium]
MKRKKEDIIRMVKEEDVEFIRLQFTDLHGRLKNMAVTAGQLEKAINNGCMFDAAAVEDYGTEAESDMYLYPDLDTFEIFPWRPQQGKVARMFCDVYETDRTPYEGDPRRILKNAIAKAKEMGYEFNVGSECEFFLFNTDENAMPTTYSREKAGYFDCGPVDFGENARRDIVLTLEQMNLTVESSHHEMAPAQHEVDFKYSDALNTADNIQTFRLAVKTIAKRHGLHATFMPKPKADCNGSGMHLNMSLTRNGKNVFYDSKDELGLSKEAYYFLGGIAKHIKAITAITNPIVNSYKRIISGERSLFRIPVSEEDRARIELRSPDPSANPYLALAVCLSAGLNGIEEKIMPTKNMLTKWNAGILPTNLMEALDELKKDKLIKDVLGKTMLTRYLDIKEREWREYQSQVTEWEIEQYLDRY